MGQENSFADLMHQLRHGDEDAARRIFQQFGSRLISKARRKLDKDKRLRAKIDPADVIQSVFKSFFSRLENGEWDLKNWDSFWSLLVVITLHKCGHKLRDFHRERRDVRKEKAPDATENTSGWEAVGREPSPLEVMTLADTLEQVMGELKEIERNVLALRL